MSSVAISPRIWPTVVGESSRFWLRRHRLIITLAILALCAGIALRLAGYSDRSDTIMSALVAFVPLGAGLLTMSGIVADERLSGVILLWYQKPGSILRSYGIRYGIQQGMLAALALTIGITLIGLDEVGLATLHHPYRTVLILLAFAWLPASIVFAFSAWGVRRDSAAALLVMMGSVMIAAAFAFTDSIARDVVMTIAFPVDSIERIGNVPAGELLLPIVHVAGQIVAWTGIGMLGLLYTQRVLHRDV